MFALGNPGPRPSTSRFPVAYPANDLRPPGDESDGEPPVEIGFDARPLPAFNDNSIATKLEETLTFIWCIGEYCEMTCDHQTDILQEAVRCLTRTALKSEVQLHTFSRDKSSLVYQDNPVYVVK
jgi:hypothetical protein